MKVNIVLVNPEIPANTGNIVRTCVATGSALHLVRPLGFDTSDKMLKRAGMDYWYEAQVYYYDSLDEVKEKFKDSEFYYLSTHAPRTYYEANYSDNCFLVFGRESAGLGQEVLKNHYEETLRIPMVNDTRSLNLSNSVAVVVYEAYRQNNFDSFTLLGDLTKG